ncbi:MAG: hypothetical protein LIO90_09655 [Bacteroidales bacterium]|nr:hypothetical protein [Bacteroidales bacterium]
MKRFSFILVFLLCCLASYAAHYYVVTANSAVNIRTNPSEQLGRVIGHLQPGDTIQATPEWNNPEKWVMMMDERSVSGFGYVCLDYLTKIDGPRVDKSSLTLWYSDIPLYGFNSEWLHVKANALAAIGVIVALWIGMMACYYRGKYRYTHQFHQIPRSLCYTGACLFLALSIVEILYVCALGLDSMWILDEIWTSGGLINVCWAVLGYCVVFVMVCFQYVAFMYCVLVCYLVYLFIAHAPVNTNKVTVVGSDGVQYQIWETDIDQYNAGVPVNVVDSEFGSGYAKNKRIARGINSPRIEKPRKRNR